jgi:hypothetical protein
MGIDADDRFRPPTMKQTLRTPSSVGDTYRTVSPKVRGGSLRVHLRRSVDERRSGPVHSALNSATDDDVTLFL